MAGLRRRLGSLRYFLESALPCLEPPCSLRSSELTLYGILSDPCSAADLLPRLEGDYPLYLSDWGLSCIRDSWSRSSPLPALKTASFQTGLWTHCLTTSCSHLGCVWLCAWTSGNQGDGKRVRWSHKGIREWGHPSRKPALPPGSAESLLPRC